MTGSDAGQYGQTRGKAVSFAFIFLTIIYDGAIVFADQYFDIEIQIAFEAELWTLLLGVIFGSWFLRYLRWFYVLTQLHCNHSFLRGFVIYLSGFAHTATPGKGGELVRLRYLSRLGFSKGEVLAAFLYERSLDLFVVLILASLAFLNHELFHLSTLFVAVVVGFIAISVNIARRRPVSVSQGLSPVALTLVRVRDGLAICGKHLKDWSRPKILFASISLELAAWLLVAISFVLMLDGMGIELPMNIELSAYPLSMLAGAASMLPGGLVASEAGLAFIVKKGISFAQALSAAIAIRLLTLWSAVFVGTACVLLLELKINCNQSALAKMMLLVVVGLVGVFNQNIW